MKKNYYFYSYFLLFLGLLFLTYSCKSYEKENETTFFGGKIKNPKGAYVYFSKDDKIIDSAKINQQNRFSFALDSITTGLYTFKHGVEYQYLYLEPQDSLLIYLNTWDFDESLIFSGKGSVNNNFMINLFLQQEKIEKKFKNYYRLNEEEFSQKVDEEQKNLMLQYNDLIKSQDEELTEFFENLAQAIINYPLYSKKEFYPLWHKDANNKHDNPTVSDRFYDYRKNLNYNDKSLFNLRAYTYYLESLLYNLAYNKQKIDPAQDNFSLNFMTSVNEILVDEKLKNKYLASGFWGSFKDHLTDEQQKESQDYFFKNCTNEVYLAEAKHAIDQCNQLKNGDKLPELVVMDSDNNEVNIHEVVNNKKTVIYFWPKDYGRSEKLMKKIPIYKEKYPEILFIGIERNKTNDAWKEFLTTNKLPNINQYLIDENCKLYSWFDGDMARTLIVDKNGIVNNGFLFFNDTYNLEKNLHLLKKQ
ncbi:MAG: hypothetical protein ABFR32_05455 [Bacteroidota bacterium]